MLHVQGITQVIDTDAGRVENIAEFRIANAADGYLNVEGTVEPASTSGSEEAVRVDVQFTAFSLKIGALPPLKIPLGFANPTVCTRMDSNHLYIHLLMDRHVSQTLLISCTLLIFGTADIAGKFKVWNVGS